MKSFAGIAFLVCVVSIGGALTRPAAAASPEELILQRLDALEKENATLRARVNHLEAVKAVTAARHPSTAATQPSQQNAENLAAAPVMPPVTSPPRLVDQAIDVVPAGPQHRFEISGSLLYLQPGAGNLEYGTLISPLPITSPNWSNQSLKPGFSPAFGVGFRYIANAANDIDLNWTHLNTMTTDWFMASPTQMVGPPYLIGPNSSPYSIGQGSARFDYDAITLDGGHTFCTECPFQLRVFGGVEFARIGQEVSGLFLSTDGSDSSGYTNHSLFTGVGPRLGVKGQYAFGDFSLIGEAGAAGLIGTMKSHLDFTTNTPAVGPNAQAIFSPNQMLVVPSIDARMAVAYTFPSGSYGQFKLEAGYKAAVYFDAISNYALTQISTTIPVTGVFLATEQHSFSNFTNHGPYMTGTWAF
jgi:hypothetical protein